VSKHSIVANIIEPLTAQRGTQRLLIPASAVPHRGAVIFPRDVINRVLPRSPHCRLFQARVSGRLPTEIMRVDECNVRHFCHRIARTLKKIKITPKGPYLK
jgi:hypothetical protein